MTPTEAAKALDIPLYTLYTKINRKKGIGAQFKRIKGTWHIDALTLAKYINVARGPQL